MLREAVDTAHHTQFTRNSGQRAELEHELDELIEQPRPIDAAPIDRVWVSVLRMESAVPEQEAERRE